MLDNLHLVAIVRNGDETSLLHIPLHQALQVQLAEELGVQFANFMGDVAEVPFDPGYSPDPHERFSIGEYVMPDWLQDETSQTVSDHDSLSLHEDQLEAIKGIVAFARDAQGDEIILFQDFNRSHMIKPGRFLLLQHDTFESVSRPALTLGSKLDAVILPAERRLLFRSFRVTNTFYRSWNSIQMRLSRRLGRFSPMKRLLQKMQMHWQRTLVSGFESVLPCCAIQGFLSTTRPIRLLHAPRLMR